MRWHIIFIMAVILIPLINAELEVGFDNDDIPKLELETPSVIPSLTGDTNATTECADGEVLLGNSSCMGIALIGGDGGDFYFTDFQASFTLNWTALDYDKWMYNQTLAVSGAGDNSSWNESYADILYSDIVWGYNMTINSIYYYNQSLSPTITQWLYNQTLAVDGYNYTIATFNQYGKWWYNMTHAMPWNYNFTIVSNRTAADYSNVLFGIIQMNLTDLNTSIQLYYYNMSESPTITKWLYNMTTNSVYYYNQSHQAPWDYNQTSESIYYYNQTSSSKYYYNQTLAANQMDYENLALTNQTTPFETDVNVFGKININQYGYTSSRYLDSDGNTIFT